MAPKAGRRFLLFALGILLATGFLLSMLSGPVKTSPGALLDFLLGRDQNFRPIFWDIRLPRTLLAFLVGASLSLAGAILQGYFQNPMADPFVVGVSSGSSLGAVLCLVLGLNTTLAGFSAQSLFAFITGYGIVLIVYALSLKKGFFKVETLLLTGVAAGALASSLTSFLLFLRVDSYEQAVFWLLGSLQLANWKQAGTVAPYFLICLVLCQWLAKDMNLLSLGDETAQSLGCPVRRVRKIFLAVATLLAAVSVSVSGIIGFVGLVVPHWIRILIGPDHRYLFPFSALTGGIFLVFCDLIARLLLPSTELPIGIITAAVGAPFFLFLLHRRK